MEESAFVWQNNGKYDLSFEISTFLVSHVDLLYVDVISSGIYHLLTVR